MSPISDAAVIHVYDSELRLLRSIVHEELVAADGLALDRNRREQ